MRTGPGLFVNGVAVEESQKTYKFKVNLFGVHKSVLACEQKEIPCDAGIVKFTVADNPSSVVDRRGDAAIFIYELDQEISFSWVYNFTQTLDTDVIILVGIRTSNSNENPNPVRDYAIDRDLPYFSIVDDKGAEEIFECLMHRLLKVKHGITLEQKSVESKTVETPLANEIAQADEERPKRCILM